jgi:glycosyltransferase involved in cell wall biosynthesis
MARFSVCIPNYNYEDYLGATLDSVLAQELADLEVVVSDNASTDGSVALVQAAGDARVSVHVNHTNVGFSANLDRAAGRATGELVLMLSSDDLVYPDALAVYDRLFANQAPERMVVSATCDLIDGDGVVHHQIGPDRDVWHDARDEPELSKLADAPVRSLAADELLRRCLTSMRNPFNFLATAYPRSAYDAVEGYRGSRLMNPDKWFHWRLLGVVERAYFVDRPLFAYRWHAANQTALQRKDGALKLLVDDYTSTFEVDEALLASAGVTRQAVAAAFVEHDIGRHGLATLARGDRRQARRILSFGRAAYPDMARSNRKVLALRALTALGPIGQRAAAAAYRRRPDARLDLADAVAGRA